MAARDEVGGEPITRRIGCAGGRAGAKSPIFARVVLILYLYHGLRALRGDLEVVVACVHVSSASRRTLSAAPARRLQPCPRCSAEWQLPWRHLAAGAHRESLRVSRTCDVTRLVGRLHGVVRAAPAAEFAAAPIRWLVGRRSWRWPAGGQLGMPIFKRQRARQRAGARDCGGGGGGGRGHWRRRRRGEEAMAPRQQARPRHRRRRHAAPPARVAAL